MTASALGEAVATDMASSLFVTILWLSESFFPNAAYSHHSLAESNSSLCSVFGLVKKLIGMYNGRTHDLSFLRHQS